MRDSLHNLLKSALVRARRRKNSFNVDPALFTLESLEARALLTSINVEVLEGLEPGVNLGAIGAGYTLAGYGAELFEISASGDLQNVEFLSEETTYELIATLPGGTGSTNIEIKVISDLPNAGLAADETGDYVADLLVSEALPIGANVMSVTMSPGGNPATEYRIVEESVPLTIDNNGNISLSVAVDFESEFVYRFTVESRESEGGIESQSFLMVVTDDPSDGLLWQNFPQPVARRENDIIRSISGTEIDPTRFGDLPVKLQLAVQRNLRIITRGVAEYQILNSDGSVSEVRSGPVIMDSPTGRWFRRLNEANDMFSGSYVYKQSGVGKFITALKQATAGISYDYSNANQNPEFDFGTMRSGPPENELLITILHESVHAVDWRGQLNLKANRGDTMLTPGALEKAEGIAYTVQYMWQALSHIRSTERAILGPNPGNNSLVARQNIAVNNWHTSARALRDILTTGEVHWVIGQSANMRICNASDVERVNTQLGLKIAMTAYQAEFDRLAQKQGMAADLFKLTGVVASNGMNPVDIPVVFR